MATGKGGYDYDFVTAPPKSLECPVCLMTFRDPHVISCCGNEFCQLCIERVQRDGKPCPLCNEPNFTTLLHKKLVREVNGLVVRCPQEELGCEWEGELGQVEQHLNPGDGLSSSSGCGYVMVECRFQCGAHLHRRMVGEHEMESCPKRPIEMQVASLMRKFEVITTENKMLKQELVEVKEAHKKTTVDYLAIERRCASLQTHTTPLPVPPFYFRVANVEYYMKNNWVYRSEPFYSHPGGYKMAVTIYPNGVSIFRGRYIFLGVAIQCGEFDDRLRWPFKGEVTVQAYNYTAEKWSNEKAIRLSKEICGVKHVDRCVDVQAYKSCIGHNDYLPHSELKQYIARDGGLIRFRVTKVEFCN